MASLGVPNYNRSVDARPSDGELVERTLAGDDEAFGVLAERYFRMISVLAYQKTGHRTDAEDLVQEALVRAFRALPSLRAPDRFGAWLYHITLKLCIDWSRRKERRKGVVTLDEQGLIRAESARLRRAEAGVGSELEAAEEHRRVLEAVGRLPEKYALVVTLRYVEKMSYKQIAEHLGEPPGTIANRLHRATKMLQERLGVRLRLEGPR
ncbi:MAG: sigma-70 family RNA polymerase sigma factor [Planctomycetota bacterium]|nr:MAG: sigma-70 family RNA polymerase sigma factor [Planctomycetota bacterium]